MTDQEINIAIAENSGWHPHPDNHKSEQKFWTKGGKAYGKKSKSGHILYAAEPPIYDDYRQGDTSGLPDYANDLNAMHEAEKTLTVEEYSGWACLLTQVRNGSCDECCRCRSATARQRAEAFLRVKGLWKD